MRNQDGMRAGFEYFKNSSATRRTFGRVGETLLAMPVLVLGGEKSAANFSSPSKVGRVQRAGQNHFRFGHWLIDEAPQATIPALTDFLNEAQAATSGLRLTATEIAAIPSTGQEQAPRRFGNPDPRTQRGPAKPGAYTIQLNVPANTRIEAHDHRDDRSVTVSQERGTSVMELASTNMNSRNFRPAVFIPNRRTCRTSPAPETSRHRSNFRHRT
jgi:hypothetical protein